MFKKSIFIPLIGGLILTGCQNSVSSYDKMMEEGKVAIVNNEYEKADGMFELALEEKPDDKEAIELREQTEKLIEATSLKKEDKIEESKKLCNEIDSMTSKSDVVKKQANKLKKELDNTNEDKNITTKESSKDSGEKNGHSKLADERYKYIGKLEDIQNQIDSFLENYETTADMMQGTSTELKLWDDALNEIYGQIKENTNSKEMESIKQKQLDWINYRDKKAKEESEKEGDGSLSGVVYNSELAELTKERCYELVNTYMK
jgi:uncharacterized protein YecT (DUF1311 family)